MIERMCWNYAKYHNFFIDEMLKFQPYCYLLLLLPLEVIKLIFQDGGLTTHSLRVRDNEFSGFWVLFWGTYTKLIFLTKPDE